LIVLPGSTLRLPLIPADSARQAVYPGLFIVPRSTDPATRPRMLQLPKKSRIAAPPWRLQGRFAQARPQTRRSVSLPASASAQ